MEERDPYSWRFTEVSWRSENGVKNKPHTPNDVNHLEENTKNEGIVAWNRWYSGNKKRVVHSHLTFPFLLRIMALSNKGANKCIKESSKQVTGETKRRTMVFRLGVCWEVTESCVWSSWAKALCSSAMSCTRGHRELPSRRPALKNWRRYICKIWLLN